MQENIVKTIKLTTPFPEWPLVRQTPGDKGIWGDCKFFVNEEIDECDWWVVYEGLTKPEKTKCPPENTILITGEPPSVGKYGKRFLSQYGTIVTCSRNLEHPNVIYSQQSLPWHIGKHYRNEKITHFSHNYDELMRNEYVKKDKLMSVIVSNKTLTKGHRDRIHFLEKLSNNIVGEIDIFGKGIRDIEDKWDGIARYKYHLVLENCRLSDYWTEKLSDAFIGGSYPLYYGCPNIYDYFSKDSLALIDIKNIRKSVATINAVIKKNQYEKAIININESRDLVLNKYSLFPMLCNLCSGLIARHKKVELTLQPSQFFSKSFLARIAARVR